MKTGLLKKLIAIAVALCAVVAIISVWKTNNKNTLVGESYHIESVPVNNVLYPLGQGDILRQAFEPRESYLLGVDVMLVNITDETQGELVIQVQDMLGNLLKEVRVSLSTFEPAEYQNIVIGVMLEKYEEVQLCMFVEEGVDFEHAPYVLMVSCEEDIDENTECYYNDDLVGDCGIVVGYTYGDYKQNLSLTQTNVIKTILIIFLSLIVIYIVFFIKPGNLRSVIVCFTNYRLYCQFMIISIFFALFFLSAIINKIDKNVTIPLWAFGSLIIPVLLMMWTICLYIKYLKNPQNKVTRQTFDVYEWMIIAVCVVTRLPMFGTLQRWDGSIYYFGIYNAGVNFDFTFTSIWNYFRLAAHPTIMVTFFDLIGEFLFPGKAIGVLTINLIMTAIALVYIYRMLRGYWCRIPALPAAIFTIMISLQPLFWGTFSQTNIDYPLILFFIFLVYAEYKDQKILMAFWTLALLLCKETGWIIVAGYYIVYLIKKWLESDEKTIHERLAKVCSDSMVRLMFCGVLLIGFYMLLQGGIASWQNTGAKLFATKEDITKSGIGIGAIGFYLPYIGYRLVQIFVLNFMWIPTLIIIVSQILRLVRKQRKGIKLQNMECVIGAFIAFILFSIFFLTYALSRYTIFSAIIIWIIAVILFYYEIMPLLSSSVRIIAPGIITVLLVVQTFFYIDPFSNLFFERADSGKGIILTTGMQGTKFADTLVNNYRMSYLDSLFDKMLKEVSYNSNMQIIQLNGKEDQSSINGTGAFYLGWDGNKEERIFLCPENLINTENIIPINVIQYDAIKETGAETEGLLNEAIIYFLPYNGHDEETYLGILRQYYDISERKEVANWGGTLSYYTLKRKV